jgi:L-alanine-DL-glutamate epimerase-like enolase superfamily enzyme
VGIALSTEAIDLTFKDPFRLAREADPHSATTVIVDLAMGEERGVGEAFPMEYYGETVESVGQTLPRLVAAVERLGDPPADVEAARDWLRSAAEAMEGVTDGAGGSRAGVDIALHDLVARSIGIPLWQLLGTSPDIPPTDFSLGIDEPEVVRERARRVAHFPALKIKLGGPSDVATLEAVREVFSGPLRVDANTGWQPDEAAAIVPELVRLGVELIEQPFPASELAKLRWLQERSSLPIVADESAVDIDDLDGLVGVVRGVNVKLTKCGGVGPALDMLERAQELGFACMLGCMEETSVAIAAAAAVASLAEWVDLDGNLLLSEDPFEGLELGSDCRWRIGETDGLGVRRRH